MNPSSNPISERLRQAIIILFQILIFLVPLLWTPATSELFEFPKMIAVYALTVLIVGLWLSRMAVEGVLVWRSSPFHLPLFLFVISQTISTVLSINPHTSLWGYYSRFNGGLMSIVAYVLLFLALISNFTQKDLKRLLNTLLLIGLVASLYALPEHFGHSPSCLSVTGNFDAKCWVQDVQTRVFGTFGQPNWLAAYLITIIFIPLSLALHHAQTLTSKNSSNTKLLSILYLGLVAVYFLVVLFTKSRSGLLGLTVGLGIFSILTLLKTPAVKSFLSLGKFAILFIIIFVLFGKGIIAPADQVLSALFPQKSAPASTSSVVTTPSGTQLEFGGTESGEIRQIVWKGALALFKKYPLFGSGVETFAYAYYNVRPVEHNLVSEWDFLYNKAHNEFLNYLSTTGLFGLGTYLLLILVFSVWSIKRIFNSQTNPDSVPLLIAMLAGLWALNVSNFLGFSTVPVAVLFYLFPAFGVILTLPPPSLIQAVKSKLPHRTPAPPSTGQYIALAVIGVLTLIQLNVVRKLYLADTLYNQGKRLGDQNNLSGAVLNLQTAAVMEPQEPLYQDELSLNLARAALALESAGQATEAAQVASQATQLSNRVIDLNPVHLNFYKTRARVFVTLASIDNQYIALAKSALETAVSLAPTDAKLWYNLGILEEQLQNLPEALKLYQKAIALKPNYEAAHMSLASLYETTNNPDKALTEYSYIVNYINPNNTLASDKLASRSAQTK